MTECHSAGMEPSLHHHHTHASDAAGVLEASREHFQVDNHHCTITPPVVKPPEEVKPAADKKLAEAAKNAKCAGVPLPAPAAAYTPPHTLARTVVCASRFREDGVSCTSIVTTITVE